MKVIKIPRNKVEQVEKTTKLTEKKDKQAFAKRMRDNPTKSEKKFLETWKEISGHKIICQFVLCGFIADFYARTRKKKLIIEIDGSIHATQVEYDRRRDEIFREKGFHVLRLTADHVMRDPEHAVGMALRELGARKPMPRVKRVKTPKRLQKKPRKQRVLTDKDRQKIEAKRAVYGDSLRDFLFATDGL